MIKSTVYNESILFSVIVGYKPAVEDLFKIVK